jgi:hypothetical protein
MTFALFLVWSIYGGHTATFVRSYKTDTECQASADVANAKRPWGFGRPWEYQCVPIPAGPAE